MFPLYTVAEDDRRFGARDRMGVENGFWDAGSLEDDFGFGLRREFVREVRFFEGGACGAG